MKTLKRFCALLSGAMAICLLTTQILAAGIIDLNHPVSLTVTCQKQGTPLSGVVFSIYQVATVDAYGELTVTEDFQQFKVDIRGKNDAAWQQLASTLEGYILRDGITSQDSGTTDARGQLTFPTGETPLAAGLYLVLGQRHIQDGYRCDPAPFLALLPCQDQAANTWVYSIAADAKCDISKIPDDSRHDTVNRKVLKVWDDDGENRPKRISVQLLRDGKVYDTVTLSEKNNWRHTWTELNNNYSWRVVEETVPDGYSVTVRLDGITFVVTNTLNTPDKPDTPDTPDAPDTPDTPKSPDNPSAPDTAGQPKLPQTGQLWWPVPVLAAAGLLLIAAGLLYRREDIHET